MASKFPDGTGLCAANSKGVACFTTLHIFSRGPFCLDIYTFMRNYIFILTHGYKEYLIIKNNVRVRKAISSRNFSSISSI